MNNKRLNALIKGCQATTADVVTIEPSHAIEVLGLDTCEINNLFNWVVEAETVNFKQTKPGSVIPRASTERVHGFAEVNREKFLELLLEVQKEQTSMTRARIDPIKREQNEQFIINEMQKAAQNNNYASAKLDASQFSAPPTSHSGASAAPIHPAQSEIDKIFKASAETIKTPPTSSDPF